MSKLFLVRHGPTNRKGLIGWTDVPVDLADTDMHQRLDARLPDIPVISSTLIRAVGTADAFLGERPRLPHHKDLREFHFGDWEEKSATDVSETAPELAKNYWSNPGHHAPPGGESWDQGAARMTKAIDDLMEAHGDIIVVAHMGVVLTQIARAARIAPVKALAFKIDNYSVTTLERLDHAYWRVLGINHVY